MNVLRLWERLLERGIPGPGLDHEPWRVRLFVGVGYYLGRFTKPFLVKRLVRAPEQTATLAELLGRIVGHAASKPTKVAPILRESTVRFVNGFAYSFVQSLGDAAADKFLQTLLGASLDFAAALRREDPEQPSDERLN